MTRKLSNVLKIMETIISNLEIDNQTIKMLFRHVLKKKIPTHSFSKQTGDCATPKQWKYVKKTSVTRNKV